MRSRSLFLAGHLYYDLCERHISRGQLFEVEFKIFQDLAPFFPPLKFFYDIGVFDMSLIFAIKNLPF